MMKRFHVHVAVEDLAQSVRFYSTLFAAEPTVLKPEYAKWMLEDPRVNFAISIRNGERSGISHLGIQAEDQGQLAEVCDRLADAERPIVEEKATTCCYAQSDKQWIADPQGVAWETFLTYGESTVYGEGSLAKLKEVREAACCSLRRTYSEGVSSKQRSTSGSMPSIGACNTPPAAPACSRKVTFRLKTPSAMQSAPRSPGARKRPDRERRRGRATPSAPR